VRDALFVASPNIIERFHLWTDEPDSERGRKVEHVLVRYFSRMTGRATPFGLFAGVSVGTIRHQTQLLTAGREKYQRHTRLDMDYLFALAEALGRDPELRSQLTYHPNSSLYRAAGRVRYVESRLEDKVRSYHLVAVEETEYLNATLALSKTGATFSVLAAALVDDEISSSEAEEYVTQLIESQILVPEIRLPVTGPEPIHPLVDQLYSHANTVQFAEKLDLVRNSLSEIDKAGLGVETERYRKVAQILGTLPAKVELPRLFQVDMVKPAPEATLGTAVLDEIIRGVDMLHSLAQPPVGDPLSQFREAFVARYEQREVPLVEALDEEVGIGLGVSDETSPLLKDLVFPAAQEKTSIEPIRHTMLLRKLSEALQRSAQEITFESSDLETISSKDPLPLPHSFSVSATLIAESQSALNLGDFRLLVESVTGPSGAILMGRFCHADETLQRCVKSYLRAEEALEPDVDFAEIVHLPEGRVGNVIVRPVLREYEIPYLGRSGLSPDRQFPVTDLYLSVQGTRIRLRSVRTGREIIPRMTNAHNYAWGSLGMYRFLCMLQHQERSGCPPWEWGVLSSAPFLPRVRAGRLVLALARWRLNKEELRALGTQKGVDRFRALQRLRVERRFPRLVALADADNLLPVDLDNVLSVESFIQLVKDREEATLKEVFPGPDKLCAYGPEGRFVHELIVPFIKGKETRVSEDGDRRSQGGAEMEGHRLASRRHFPPGSEWLFAKLYTGTATADALLKNIVRPLTKSLLQLKVVDRWFFIRYADPAWHLRLRFHGLPDKLHRKGLPRIQDALNPLLDDGSIWRVQLDTYERELERYGGVEGIVLAEQLFYLDSEAVLEIIEMLEPGDEGADERWRLTLCGIDCLLTDFGFDLENKRTVLKQVRDAFGKEFRVDKTLVGQLSEKYRKERKSLETLLNSDHNAESSLSPGLAVLRHRSEQLVPLVAELKSHERSGKLSVPLVELASSYVHMHANRLLRSVQRQQELVLYDLLSRFYESQAARS
ncbi:MAG TPA: lantibiotic dehydratase, partial [Pyrinomonadaceae bacterium]